MADLFDLELELQDAGGPSRAAEAAAAAENLARFHPRHQMHIHHHVHHDDSDDEEDEVIEIDDDVVSVNNRCCFIFYVECCHTIVLVTA